MKRFRTSVTYIPEKGEENFSPSLTVPDQNLSVREMLTKFANGTLGDVMTEPLFSEDMPDLRNLDLVERQELEQKTKQSVKELKEAYESHEAEKKRKKTAQVENNSNPEKPE